MGTDVGSVVQPRQHRVSDADNIRLRQLQNPSSDKTTWFAFAAWRLGDLELRRFLRPDLQNSEPPSGERKEMFCNCLCLQFCRGSGYDWLLVSGEWERRTPVHPHCVTAMPSSDPSRAR